LQAVAWLSAFLQGVAAFFLHGMILCIEPGGHTAVEWLATSECCLETAAETSLSSDRCGGCTDAALLQPVEKRDATATFVATATELVPGPTAAHSLDDRRNRAASRAPAPPDDLSARRTVVLQA
jgi:hypothetical protein